MLPIIQIVLSIIAGALLGYLLARPRSAENSRLVSGGATSDLYRVGFDQAPVGIAHLGIAGQWLQVNRRFAIALGYSVDELMKAPLLHTMIHPEERKQQVSQTKKLLGGELKTLTALRRIQMKDGRYGTFRVWMSASRRKPEFVECVIGEADSAPPPDSGATLPVVDLLDQLDDVALIRSNPNAIITSCNRGAEILFGYKSEQMVGKARSLLYRDADVWSEKPTRDLRTAVASRRTDFEDERVGKDGFVFSTRVTIVPEVEGEVLKGFAEIFRASVRPAESEEQRKERERLKQDNDKARQESEKAKSEIERLTLESSRFREAAKRAEQVGRANEDLRKENDSLRADVRKKEGIEESLREALQQLRMTDEELMNELKVMTDTLRREIERRKNAEQFLQEAEVELSRTSAEWQQRLDQLKLAEAADTAAGNREPGIAVVPPLDQLWRSFDEAGPMELLIEMGQEHRSGTLFIVAETMEKKIFFSEGRIYSCASNVPSLYLAELLTANGTITEQQRVRAIEISRQAGIALGRILVIMDAVSEEQLVEVMHQKIEREVEDLLALTDGRSTFVDGEMPLVQMIPLRVEVVPLIENALARSMSRKMEPTVPELESGVVAVAAPVQFELEDGVPAPVEPGQGEALDAEREKPVEETLVVDEVVSADVPSEADETVAPDAPVPAEPATQPARREPEPDLIVGSRSGKSKKYHRSTCPNARRIAASVRVSFGSVAEAEAAGYQRCKMCFGR